MVIGDSHVQHPCDDASLSHVRARLEVLEARVAAAVARRRARLPGGEDRLRGVFLSEVEVEAR
jgi:hypothetical protein